MKKLNQKANRANRKKSREGQKKQKRKSVPAHTPPKPVAATATKRRSTLVGNRFESCFQPDGRLDHDHALLESLGRKYGNPNLATFCMSDYLATASTREMFYRVELLLYAQAPDGNEELCWDLIYNFRDHEFVQDRRYSEGLTSFRPYEFPEVYASLQEAAEAFNEIMRRKDEPWIPTPDMEGDMRLKGCWIVGCDNDSPIQTEEESWVAKEGDSHETLKMQRLVCIMLHADGVEGFA